MVRCHEFCVMFCTVIAHQDNLLKMQTVIVWLYCMWSYPLHPSGECGFIQIGGARIMKNTHVPCFWTSCQVYIIKAEHCYTIIAYTWRMKWNKYLSVVFPLLLTFLLKLEHIPKWHFFRTLLVSVFQINHHEHFYFYSYVSPSSCFSLQWFFLCWSLSWALHVCVFLLLHLWLTSVYSCCNSVCE